MNDINPISETIQLERIARRRVNDAMPSMTEVVAERLKTDCYGRRVIPLSHLRSIKVALRGFNVKTGKWA